MEDQSGGSTMNAGLDGMRRDLRQGLRLLWRQPGFTVAAVAVLALGIGANTAMFSLVNSFLFKPLRVAEPERLVNAFNQERDHPDSFRGFSYAEYEALRGHRGVFTELVGHNLAMVGIADGREASASPEVARRAFAEVTSANYFRLFGVSLAQGREFSAAEEAPGSGVPVVILGHGLWQRLGGEAFALGRQITVNGRSFTVVGVAPAGFTGTAAIISPEIFLPLGVYDWVANDFGGSAEGTLADPRTDALMLIGRLAPGVSMADADAQLAAISPTLPSSDAATTPRRVIVRSPSRFSFSTQPTDDTMLRVPSILLLSMAAIVLLVASLNVANMMLARGSTRRREISVRLALGAGRGSVLRQLVVEGLLLSFLGGLAGLALASWGTTALVRSLGSLAPLEIIYDARPDLRVLTATFLFCVASTLVFGLAPAMGMSRRDVTSGLKGQDTGSPAGRSGWRRYFARRNALVIGQLALSLMLLATAGLFLRSSLRTANLAPGFRVDRSVVVEIDPALAGYAVAERRDVAQRAAERLAALPGVESVAWAATVPFGQVSLGRAVQRASDAPPASLPSGDSADRDPTVHDLSLNVVSAGYFRTLEIPLLAGRAFAERETAADGAPVVVLSRAAAAKLWPDSLRSPQQAIGQRVRLLSRDTARPHREAEVVGISGDVTAQIIGANGPEAAIYVPWGQEAQSNVNLHVATLAVGEGTDVRLLEAIRRELRALDPRLPVLALKTFRAHLESGFDFWLARTAARMFALFGGVALLMAVVGLYGVRAYSVGRRTREIGIRMAIGASASDTSRMVLREGLDLTVVGLGIGLVLALGIGQVLSGMLYEVSGFDPWVLGGSALVLAASSLVACYLPARRAASIEPMAALRED
jgi:predicted permease